MSQVEKSPFHRGEQWLQTQVGVRDKMEHFGRQVIRGFMPEQHRKFYQQLPYVFVGHADADGWPWASVLFSDPGFMQSPDKTQLDFLVRPLAGDPLQEGLQPGAPLGLLGIELHSRRRNRLSGTIEWVADAGWRLAIEQTFGNCPQYIQARSWRWREGQRRSVTRQSMLELDDEAMALIGASDTFFVASCVTSGAATRESQSTSAGVDVSHRGGRPGFIRVDHPRQLTIPDFAGNYHFNTLGNFVENPRAGLLFLDFTSGHILMLTGRAEILWNDPDTQYFEGAQRLWQFSLEKALWLRDALPIDWQLASFSPSSLANGTWAEARQAQPPLLSTPAQAEWQGFEVARIANESSVIRSFYLVPEDGSRAQLLAGQFLTLQAEIDGQILQRTYSVSSAADEPFYRISVKRDGVFSQYLHEQVKAGQRLQARLPMGNFHLAAAESDGPLLLLAAGVGITPMMSIIKQVLNDNASQNRSERAKPRSVQLIAVARNQLERAFYAELISLQRQGRGCLQVFWCLTEPQADFPRNGYDYHGRPTSKLLQAHVPGPNGSVFLCGPTGFMQATYDVLRNLGVDDSRILAEAFGPASLQRDRPAPAAVAEAAQVVFVDSAGDVVLEQLWQAADGNLLEFAEQHGLTPSFGCRVGQCGSCAGRLRQGKVSSETPAGQADEVLLCCSQPAAIEGDEMARITLQLLDEESR